MAACISGLFSSPATVQTSGDSRPLESEICLDKPAIRLESKPPDKTTPTGTSDISLDSTPS